MLIPVLALFLVLILALLLAPVQDACRGLLRRSPFLVWALALCLAAVFAAAATLSGAGSLPLDALVLVYVLLPVACVYGQQPLHNHPPTLRDLAAILLLWLPLEFALGARLVPRPAQGFLHSLAYGVAILLGLALFLCYRQLPGMKYNPPRAPRDLWLPLAGFTLAAPILILLGRALGFLPPAHWPHFPPGRAAAIFGIIFVGTALPEEILFRALIQNWITQRLGETERSLLLAAFIFGCAHLNNGPQPLPNWRYMILATIAGYAYGKVFRKSSTILSSALFHALVDWTKHMIY